MKLCCGCLATKPFEEFRPDKRNRSGVGSRCKECCRVYDRSEKKKLARRMYRKSSEGKLAYRRFRFSENGQLANRLARIRRRENEILVGSTLSTSDMKLVHERFDHKCFKCNSMDDLTIDHHYPLSMGYGLSYDNAVLLCRSCNSAKSSRLPEEFYSPEELVRLEGMSISVFHRHG